ncbi:hypothetical protein G5B31_17395 [Rhodobacter sp. SGA-6-6]|uniref:hypothetical protein n=1 Tax=Rhodobacter sp. SGA-6-6 TaxID=2710882 RepID=UPI0013EE369D|nr:hypothetical protein [Rhodobacter sp. SGA-6-6]NGM47315.1 hypothetical protein [Rhodobacter sp. SGA-6-6]
MRRLLILPLILAACGPVSVQQAERDCYERARLAQQPRGMVKVGAASGGRMAGGLDLSVSSDYLLGKDPSAVFETCVMARSGQAPTRPLYDMPGWKG